jgi:hypothetical protein
MDKDQTVAVVGAYGHTGQFVVTELRERGFGQILIGRDPEKLASVAAASGGVARPADLDDHKSIDAALEDASAVINCAGPFAYSNKPVIAAALRAGIPYVDVAAEIEANLDTFANYAEQARVLKAIVVPAMAFFGGLADLLATSLMADWTAADEAHVAYGLSSWHPTKGTRSSGVVSHQRRDGRRVRFVAGKIEYRDDPRPQVDWRFPEPLGVRAVISEFSMADIVTIPSHLLIPEVRSYMTAEAASDVADPATPEPAAVDDRGRSSQTFVVDVLLRRGIAERRATASGQDIYAISAPLAVEAVRRILAGETKTTGVASAGAIFDATDFLKAMASRISVEIDPVAIAG